LALPRAARVQLTEVHGQFEGDTSLPKFDPSHWRESGREEHVSKEGLHYSFVTLDRR
jgi:dihydrofolate reductase